MRLQNIERIDFSYNFYKIMNEKDKDFLFLNGPFDKKGLQQLINCFLKKYGENYTLDFLDKLKKFGFYQANQTGISLGLDDLVIPNTKEEFIINTNILTQNLDLDNIVGNVSLIEKSQRTIFLWNQVNEGIKESVIDNFRNKIPLNCLGIMAFSGARGNITQVQQLVGMRGLMADPQGIIVEVPIKSNFKEGITLTEYLISCFGARKGLVDTALRTATSGYLTRRLVDAVEYMIISKLDCKATLGISIKKIFNIDSLIGRVLLQVPLKVVEDKQKIQSYIPFLFENNKFNYYQNLSNIIRNNQVISLSIATKLYKNLEEFNIRSPLTCNSYKSICQLCYGWDLAKGDLVNIGEAVGIIAAQSIGEPGTQLTMRTFHTGGVGVFSEEIFKTYKSPFNGIVNLPEKLPGLLIRTSHGEIGYLLKYDPIESTRILLEIKSETSVFNLQEFQIPPGSLLMVYQGQYVKTNDILIQLSQSVKKSSTLPEFLYPVQAKRDGEIFFESIHIIKSEEAAILNSIGSFLTQKRKNENFSISDFIDKKNDKILESFKAIPLINKTSIFWLLFTQNQKEAKKLTGFLRIGDLISQETPLSQIDYSLISFLPLKIKRIGTEFIFNYFDINISNDLIRFHKKFYSFYSKKMNKILFFNLSNFYEYKQNTIELSLYSKNFLLKDFNFLFFSKKFIVLNKNINNERNKILGDIIIQSFSYLSISYNIYLNLLFFLSQNINFKKQKQKKAIFYFVKNISNNIGFFQHSLKVSKNFKILSEINLKQFKKSKKKQKKRILKQNTKNILNIIIFSYKLRNNNIFLYTKQQKNFTYNIISKNKNFFFKTRKKKVLSFKQAWIFIFRSKNSILAPGSFNLSLKKFFLLKNNIFSNLSLENQTLSLDYFYSKQLIFLNYEKYYLLRYKAFFEFIFYNKKDILNIHTNWIFKFSLKKKDFKKIKKLKQIDRNLSFFKLKRKKERKNSKNSIILRIFNYKKLFSRIKNNNFLCLSIQKLDRKQYQPNFYFQLEKQSYSLILAKNKDKKSIKTNSPIFTKQTIFHHFYEYIPKCELDIQSLLKEGWFFSKNPLKVILRLETTNKETSLYNGYIYNRININNEKKIKKLQNFQIIYYTLLPKENFNINGTNYKFLLFDNEWIYPNKKVITMFKFSQYSGEFLSLKTQYNQTFWSSLNQNDIITLELPIKSFKINTNFKIGEFFRYNQILFNDFLTDFNGKLIKINKYQLTFRYGLSFLAPKESAFFLFHKNLIMKDKILFTLKSRKLETQDIVQGIPKIERLFEAREIPTEVNHLTVQNKLKMFYTNALDFIFENDFNYRLKSQSFIFNYLNFAYKITKYKIQYFLVENIIEAYRFQGVFIAEKHVEIIVREMTTRVRILSSGSTGFIPGEILQFDTVQKINNKLQIIHKNPAFYDPIVLGITKSVLYSESFLLAASFQEVSRVLIRSAFKKKTDFLLGLHENIILGQLIPAGSGLFEYS